MTHVLIRLKSDIPVTKIGDFLPDVSYLADISGGGQTIRMRVIEYYVEVDGQHVPEMFCLITDLHDWRAHPAGVLAAAYRWRWDGSETALREAKSAIRAAGPSAGPIFRSGSPDMIRAEHAAWITTCELVRATARAAARGAAPGRQGTPRRAARPPPRDLLHRCPPRRDHHHPQRHGHRQPAQHDPPRPPPSGLHDLGRRRVTVDRGRHRDHKTKARQAFPAAGRGITTRTAPARVLICGPLAA